MHTAATVALAAALFNDKGLRSVRPAHFVTHAIMKRAVPLGPSLVAIIVLLALSACSTLHTHKVGDRIVPDSGYSWVDATEKKVQWQPGSAHPTIAHILAARDEGKWATTPGYVFARTEGLEVAWKSGLRFDRYPNITSSNVEGSFDADPGYVLVGKTLLATWTPGLPHPSTPHIVAATNEQGWIPAEGYVWVDFPASMTVIWQPNQKNRQHAHVVSGDQEGQWVPEAGYRFINPKANWLVEWIPDSPSPTRPHLVAGDEEGKWKPADGYAWGLDKQIVWQADQPSRLYAHVFSGKDEGSWVTEPGYFFVDKQTSWATHWKVDIPHPRIAHIVTSPKEGVWIPADGYAWVDSSKGAQVVWSPGMPSRRYPNVRASPEEEKWLPQAGYRFLDSKVSLAVEPVAPLSTASGSNPVVECAKGAGVGVVAGLIIHGIALVADAFGCAGMCTTAAATVTFPSVVSSAATGCAMGAARSALQ